MAIYKFYNIQLLPVDNKEYSEVGADGYCKLFESLGRQTEVTKEQQAKLSSIAVKMRGGMFFAPFSSSVRGYPAGDGQKKIAHGYFLKFDNVNALIDTDSGEVQYRSKGNTSSRRVEFEFAFDPYMHILAIQHKPELPTSQPLIDALDKILGYHAVKLFKDHSLEITELTSAASVIEFLNLPKKGYKSYSGYVTFSNSEDYDADLEGYLKSSVEKEKELKEKNIAQWKVIYKCFKSSLMSDIPDDAKVQMMLATKYGNAEARYKNNDNEEVKYQMENFPVREKLGKYKEGILNRIIEIKKLIDKANEKTKVAKNALLENKRLLEKNNEDN
ncbi:DUF4747 family protein [Xenorhabdus bovienii]|uniref:DUF4747 family protein n=1 Tax=Xenorhabdus bovienii TaxID=40576 RepID=UPI00237D05D4|nr:DUF4747 family protein [Xenorhabdus bovienii]MDE1495705.1 DUF4747 family protein [Xenorhabdus bovienii]MDE9475424.1 DUF4747 family protein [Xenorhabdus bovienii]